MQLNWFKTIQQFRIGTKQFLVASYKVSQKDFKTASTAGKGNLKHFNVLFSTLLVKIPLHSFLA